MPRVDSPEAPAVKPLACPGCQTNVSARLLERSGSYDLYLCPQCAVTFADPMAAGDQAFYEAVTEYDEQWEFGMVAEQARRRGWRGLWLDVGCGDGRFLARIAGAFAVTGIDLNARAIEAARRDRGLRDVHPMTLGEFREVFPSRQYDVISLFHVVEHVADPHRFLEQVKACLKPGGSVVVGVPNPTRWTLRWFREAWDYPPHHLTRWPASALCDLLTSRGFPILEVCPEPARCWWQVERACRDLLWAITLKWCSFGLTTRSAQRPSEDGSAPRSHLRLPPHRLGRRLLALGAHLKGAGVVWLAKLLAFLIYPIVLGCRCEGRSLVIIARTRRPGEPTGPLPAGGSRG